MKRAEVEIIRHLIAKDKCLHCCVVCENSECSLCGSDTVCRQCKNSLCVNNGKYRCKFYYECDLCNNVHCVNHIRFNPREEFAKHC